MTASRAIRWAGIALIAVGAAWAIATLASHRVVASKLLSLVDEPDPVSNWRFSHLDHHAGLLASDGAFDVGYRIPGETPDADRAVALGRLQYHVSHIVAPTSLQRFDWRFEPDPAASTAYQAVFGEPPRLTGSGIVDPGGTLESVVDLPAIHRVDRGTDVQAPASRLRVGVSHRAFTFEWRVDRLAMRDPSGTTAVTGMTVVAAVPDWAASHGDYAVTVERLDGPGSRLEGLVVGVGAKLAGDSIGWTAHQSVRRAVVGDVRLDDLAWSFEVAGLPVEPVDRLIDIGTSHQGFDHLSVAERRTVSDALGAILGRGFTVGIPQLKGTMGAGKVDARLAVELVPPPGPIAVDGTVRDLALDRRLRSSGRLAISGAAFTPQQTAMLVQAGYATATGDVLKAEYRYANGALTLNDRAIDASGIDRGLAQVNVALVEALRKPPLPVAVPAVAPSPPPPPVEASAQPPTPAIEPASATPVATPSPPPVTMPPSTVAPEAVDVAPRRAAAIETPSAPATHASIDPGPAKKADVPRPPPSRPRTADVARIAPLPQPVVPATPLPVPAAERPVPVDVDAQRQEEARRLAATKKKIADEWARTP